MLTLQFYTREGCTLCHSALALLERIQKHLPFSIQVVDIDSDRALTARFGEVIPVVVSENQELARSFFDEKSLTSAIRHLLPAAPREDFSRSLDIYNP
jgi:thiol-disulfide isomerase/thioredoxin